MEMLGDYAFKIHWKKSEKFKAEKYDPDQKLKELDQELG